jgi:hypothetical protein
MELNSTTAAAANAVTLISELKWFDQLFRFRLFQLEIARGISASDLSANPYFEDIAGWQDSDPVNPPLPPEDESPYANLLRQHLFDRSERAALLLSLLPHFMPGVLTAYANCGEEGSWTSLGLLKMKNGQAVPTGDTLLLLLGGADLSLRLQLMQIFGPSHPFSRYKILQFEKTQLSEPLMACPLYPSQELLDMVTNGFTSGPRFGADFPAREIQTPMDWSDLILSEQTMRQVEEIKIWVEHGPLLRGKKYLYKVLKPGFRTLFYGPPGTGKTLTACLLGKHLGIPVYRIDLSLVVSKYIGETEKNLARVFDKAAHSNWILFFDEADALFGKRTSTSSAHDRYANQEVSYLLQRIEDFPGIVILASNMKANIDEAFARRFQVMVNFHSPKAGERRRLWQNAFPSSIVLDKVINLVQVPTSTNYPAGRSRISLPGAR